MISGSLFDGNRLFMFLFLFDFDSVGAAGDAQRRRADRGAVVQGPLSPLNRFL